VVDIEGGEEVHKEAITVVEGIEDEVVEVVEEGGVEGGVPEAELAHWVWVHSELGHNV
jgi:hypothetical protein